MKLSVPFFLLKIAPDPRPRPCANIFKLSNFHSKSGIQAAPAVSVPPGPRGRSNAMATAQLSPRGRAVWPLPRRRDHLRKKGFFARATPTALGSLILAYSQIFKWRFRSDSVPWHMSGSQRRRGDIDRHMIALSCSTHRIDYTHIIFNG